MRVINAIRSNALPVQMLRQVRDEIEDWVRGPGRGWARDRAGWKSILEAWPISKTLTSALEVLTFSGAQLSDQK